MSAPEKTVVVTGITGDLGLRLLREIPEFDVFGVDVPQRTDKSVVSSPLPSRFQSIDLGEEVSCRELIDLLRNTEAQAVVHLAFVDPQGTAGMDVNRTWRINVAGTARLMEAISVVNRNGGVIRKFLFISSASVYGSELRVPVREDHPLGGHTLSCAIHKRESDQAVQARANSLGACSTYILRPHIITGAMQNCLMNMLRGTPNARRHLGRWMEKHGRRLPALIPYGRRYLNMRFQYVHVDDVARLLAWILRQQEVGRKLTILNVAGRGDALSFERCAQIAGTKLTRLPGKIGCRMALNLGWKLGISSIPASAVPYFTGTCIMDTSRLQNFLGKDYAQVIRYTCEEALADSFKGNPAQ